MTHSLHSSNAGLQVSSIETASERAKAAGAVIEGGVMNYNKGRAVMIRDPDAGGYVMLWQPAN